MILSKENHINSQMGNIRKKRAKKMLHFRMDKIKNHQKIELYIRIYKRSQKVIKEFIIKSKSVKNIAHK